MENEGSLQRCFEKGIDLSSEISCNHNSTRIKHALINHVDDINAAYIDVINLSGLQMWQRLLSRYESSDPTVIQQLRDRIMNMSIRNDCEQYIATISSLVNQLRVRGVNITDADHVQYLVSGLTPHYHSVRDTLLNPTTKYDVSIVEAHIRNVHRAMRHERPTFTQSTNAITNNHKQQEATAYNNMSTL